MTALAANFSRACRATGKRFVAGAVKAAEIAYKGGMVSWDSTGDLIAAGDNAGDTFAGLCVRGFDNSAGADGALQQFSERTADFDMDAIASYAVNGTTPIAGARAFVFDDNTVSMDATTNSIDCGVFVEPDGLNSGRWFVDHSAAARGEALGIPSALTFAFAAGAANVTEVTITVVDRLGNTVAGVFEMLTWLSDAATGAGLTATTASGTVTAKAASGADFGALTAKKALILQTLATGVAILEITDTAKTGFYVGSNLVGLGDARGISSQLVSGDYGA